MAKEQAQRYAESLEKNLQNNFHHLQKTVEEFEEMCKTISPERHIPRDIIVDLREMYKDVQERIKEIKAIRQILEGRYRMYVRRDPLRDKEIMEMGFLAKSCYSKFEYTLMQIEEKAKAKEKEKAKEREKVQELEHWLRAQENRDRLAKILQSLRTPDHEVHREGGQEPQDGAREGRRVTLLACKGDSSSLDSFQAQFPWSESDIVDRFSVDEVRAIFSHPTQERLAEMEPTLRRFAQSASFSKLKYLLCRISTLKGLQANVPHLVEKHFREMNQGEIKVFSI